MLQALNKLMNKMIYGCPRPIVYNRPTDNCDFKGSIQLYMDKSKKWRWRMIDDNTDNIIASSHQSYKDIKECMSDVRLMEDLFRYSEVTLKIKAGVPSTKKKKK